MIRIDRRSRILESIVSNRAVRESAQADEFIYPGNTGCDVAFPKKGEKTVRGLIARIADHGSKEIDGILILLNTSGGDVEAGLAIAEVIAGMKKPVVSIVLGGGHSIGIPLAVAAKYSYIARSASMTVHPVRANGLTLGVPQTFEYYRKMQNRITAFVSDNSGISNRRYNELVMNTEELVLDIGTVLEGEEAVEEGLIDKVGTVRDALDRLYKMIDEKKPSESKKKR